jgi:hypothetical protein
MYRPLSLPFASFLLFQAAVSEWPFCDAVRLPSNKRRFFTLTASSVSLVFVGRVDDIVRHYFPPHTALRRTVIIAKSTFRLCCETTFCHCRDQHPTGLAPPCWSHRWRLSRCYRSSAPYWACSLLVTFATPSHHSECRGPRGSSTKSSTQAGTVSRRRNCCKPSVAEHRSCRCGH